MFYLSCPIDPGGPLGPLGRGFVILWSYPGKRRVACMWVLPGPRAGAWWWWAMLGQRPISLGGVSLTRACPVGLGTSPWIPISIDFPSALNRGRERVFRPNLSPFLSCCASSLNREGEGSPHPIPSPILEPLPLHLPPSCRACSYVAAIPR